MFDYNTQARDNGAVSNSAALSESVLLELSVLRATRAAWYA